MRYATVYLNESQLRTLTKLAVAIATFSTLVLIIFNPLATFAQQYSSEALQLNFGQALTTVQNAESAGATPSEISPLVTTLNSALQLNQEASNLKAPEDAGRRSQLLTQVNQTLTNVQNQADQLTEVASSRTHMNKVIAYAAGVIVALLGTIVYGFAAAFYQKYRVKRVFQMRVEPK
jgi:hypothetical protein